jgi:hypothetical protein
MTETRRLSWSYMRLRVCAAGWPLLGATWAGRHGGGQVGAPGTPGPAVALARGGGQQGRAARLAAESASDRGAARRAARGGRSASDRGAARGAARGGSLGVGSGRRSGRCAGRLAWRRLGAPLGALRGAARSASALSVPSARTTRTSRPLPRVAPPPPTLTANDQGQGRLVRIFVTTRAAFQIGANNFLEKNFFASRFQKRKTKISFAAGFLARLFSSRHFCVSLFGTRGWSRGRQSAPHRYKWRPGGLVNPENFSQLASLAARARVCQLPEQRAAQRALPVVAAESRTPRSAESRTDRRRVQKTPSFARAPHCTLSTFRAEHLTPCNGQPPDLSRGA